LQHMYLNAHLCIENQRVYYNGAIRSSMVEKMLYYMQKYLQLADKRTHTYVSVSNNLKAWQEFLQQEQTYNGNTNQ
jgi:hypothetical protein